MKIFSLYIEKNKFEVCVYDSLEEFTQRTEWQDALGDYFTILDEKGNIYKWDDSKTEEYATIYNYTLIIKKVDKELGILCQRNYALNNFETEFTFEK
jgi:hypothetical protein